MLDLFTNLTWPHQLLFLETLTSGLAGAVLAGRGFQRTLWTTVFFVFWNLACFALLIGGARHNSWQYDVLFCFYLLDTMLVIHHGLQRKANQPSPGCGAIVFILLMMVGILSLIVTGN